MSDDPSEVGSLTQIMSAFPPWMRRNDIAVAELKGLDGVEDAAVAINRESGRLLAFWGPDFPPGHAFAAVHEIVELAKLFDPPPDPGFEPRVRGLVIGTVHAIRHGWQTPRDARDALTAILKAPESLLPSRTLQRFLHLLAMVGLGKNPLDLITRARDAFEKPEGRPADETRRFFLEELVRIAIDNGMDPRLPQHRDQRNTGTAFFMFVLAVVDIVAARTYGASSAPPSEAVRHRLAAFQCSRVALLDAAERAREAVQLENENPLKINNSS